LPVWGQIVLALAHAEGAWLTLAPFSVQHPLMSPEALVQVRGKGESSSSSRERVKLGLSTAMTGCGSALQWAFR
jgi:hypothetical protein